jgi:hypothetical protein
MIAAKRFDAALTESWEGRIACFWTLLCSGDDGHVEQGIIVDFALLLHL